MTGRWPSRDLIGEFDGLSAELLPEGPSLYAIVGNDAVNTYDYLGLQAPGKIVVQAILSATVECSPGRVVVWTEPPLQGCCFPPKEIDASGKSSPGLRANINALQREARREARMNLEQEAQDYCSGDEKISPCRQSLKNVELIGYNTENVDDKGNPI